MNTLSNKENDAVRVRVVTTLLAKGLKPPPYLRDKGTHMKYQLVLQLPASSVEDYDGMVELEETIIKELGSLGDVDGHDIGSDEANIFIMTDEPKLAFERIQTLVGMKYLMPDMKVAYREVGKETFTMIHPLGLAHFAIT